MYKILFVVYSLLFSLNVFAYTATVSNDSAYEIQIYNGTTGFLAIVEPSEKKNIELVDGNQYQLRYTGSTLVLFDNLGSIARDGNSEFISVTFQQPQDENIIWWVKNLIIGSNSYGDAKFKSWPDAIYIPGCNNQEWGATCNSSGDSLSITFTN